ncbi:uncharacterized protein LOC128304499 [Anopheles moucheti]|uniref:uncharacterized protein LOC128304499 n=1 Tax=Anopheles moucheti TaxID=186751 RepID=UPI0022F0FF21|nr:uncharacterized protein LOC128304499 [Anopheles moucheti]
MEVKRYQLSIDDCSMIVEADREIGVEVLKVIKYELEQVPGQPGYLGEYYYLTIYYKTVHESIMCGRYFMKSLPYHDLVLTKAVQEWGVFRKEAELYCELFNRFERSGDKVIKWVPDCLLARNHLLVMEDLSRAGYRTTQFLHNSLNEQHMKLVFDRLAQMHACSLHFEANQLEANSIESLYGSRVLFETTFTPTSGWFVAGLKGIQKVALERNHYAKDPVKRTIIEDRLWSNLERIYTLAESTDEFRSVVVHRDLWVNNIMFKYDQTGNLPNEPTDCMLIDFQLARYLPPAVDYLSALYLLTDSAHRKQYEKNYDEYYYNSLRQKLTLLGLDGSSILPMEQFRTTLNHYRLLALVWTGVLHGFVNFPKGVLARLHHEDPETYTRMSMEDRDDFIIKYYDSDRFYRDRLNDLVTELLEYLFDFK